MHVTDTTSATDAAPTTTSGTHSVPGTGSRSFSLVPGQSWSWLTENLASTNAAHGIRVNTILPGLMNTPMAIENRVTETTSREEVIAGRNRRVPLGREMGTAWDVANASLFLHSDQARLEAERVGRRVVVLRHAM